MRFLKGLNDKFSGVRSEILLLDPLPPINKVFGLVVQQERQLSLEYLEEPKALAAASYGRNNSTPNQGFNKFKSSKNDNKMCSYCGRVGHTVDACYKKHGYPPNQKRWGSTAANLTSSIDDENEDTHKDEVLQLADLSLSKEQLQGLMTLLQSQMQQVSSPSTTQPHTLNQVSITPKENQSNSGLSNQAEDWLW